MTKDQRARPKPTNEIDLQAMTTTPHISSEYMSDSIRNKFKEYREVTRTDESGKSVVTLELDRDFWANMEIFTQDLRLGNLNKEESTYVRYNIDLAFDILTVMPKEFHKSGLLLLERSFNITETSQSKGGFLRRMFNTFFQKSSVKEVGATKRSFFGLGKKKRVEE